MSPRPRLLVLTLVFMLPARSWADDQSVPAAPPAVSLRAVSLPAESLPAEPPPAVPTSSEIPAPTRAEPAPPSATNTLGEPAALPLTHPELVPPTQPPAATNTLGQPAPGVVFGPSDQLQVGLRGFVQIDGRSDQLSSGTASPDDFYLRRIRPDFRATAFNTFEVRLQPELSATAIQVLDAYVDVSRWKLLGIRAGKFKTPLSLEVLQDTDKVMMIEQSLSGGLAPNRDIGLIAYGEVLGGGLTYQVGLLQGTPDNSSNPDTDQGKEGVARLFLQPFVALGSLLKGFGVGAAGSIGHADGSNVNTGVGSELPTYTTAGQDPILTYRSGVLQTGSRSHFSAQTYYHLGRFGLFGEFLESNRQVDSGKHLADLHNHGIQGTASLLLTNDRASFTGVIPSSPFDPSKLQFGAVELVARASQLKLDPATFPIFANPATSSQSSTELLGGLNWYCNAFIRLSLNGGETLMSGGRSEQLVLGMVQGTI